MAHATERPRWRGINHLALITTDMDATVRFYHGVLGARLVADDRARPASATTSSSSAPAATVAFFEYAAARRSTAFAKPAGVPDPRAIQFDHLSFNVPDEEALEALRDRLKEHGCEVTDVVDHGFIRSIYFTDPNGIALEASWWVETPPMATPTTATRAVRRPRPGPGSPRADRDRRHLVAAAPTHLVHEPTDIVDPA